MEFVRVTRKVERLGWLPDLPDHRDFAYRPTVAHLPASVDLRPNCPSVYDQGQLGSCTANAIAAAVEYGYKLEHYGKGFGTPSRLFVYYGERVIEHTVSTDAGAMIRDGIKVVHAQGAPPEKDWPYNVARFADKPPTKAFADAEKHLVASYHRVNRSVTAMQACLAEGFPFVFGFTVYESFESDDVARTGVVPMPSKGEQVVGGHAVMAVGYDNAARTFLVRNSWGASWGQAGYFTMPAAYVANANLAADYWTIRTVA